jgi:MFS family permease
MDYLGVMLWVPAVVLGFSGFASLGESYSVAALVLGVIFGVLFVIRCLRSPCPLLDITLFTRSRRFAFSSLAAFVSYVASFSVTTLLSLYFQYSKGLSPAVTGTILISQPLFQAMITPMAGRLSDRMDPGILASGGLMVILLGLLIIAIFIGPDVPLWVMIVAMCLCGAGFALFSAPNSNAILSSAPPGGMGQASGVISVTRLTGQISSAALTTLVFSLVIGSGEISPDKHPLFIKAAKVLFWIFVPLCVAAIFASRARGKEER